jgi:hypothetical protein
VCHSCQTSYHHAEGHATGTTYSWHNSRIEDVNEIGMFMCGFFMLIILLRTWKSGGKNASRVCILIHQMEVMYHCSSQQYNNHRETTNAIRILDSSSITRRNKLSYKCGGNGSNTCAVVPGKFLKSKLKHPVPENAPGRGNLLFSKRGKHLHHAIKKCHCQIIYFEVFSPDLIWFASPPLFDRSSNRIH